MKKFFSSMVALLLVLSITACNNTTQNEEKEENTSSQPTVITTEAEETTEVALTTAPEQETEEIINTEKNETSEKSDDETSDTTTKKSTTTKKTSTTKKATTTKKPVTTKNPTTTKKPSTTAQSNKLPNYTPEAEVKTLFNKINNYRAENGLNKVALDSTLCKLAYLRALEQRKLKGHTRPDGSDYYTIFDEYKYSYYGCGENIAFVSKASPDEIFNRWKDSSAHKGNMLGNKWTKSGMAMCKNPDGTYTIVHLYAC